MNFIRNLVIAASVVSMNLGAVAMAAPVKPVKVAKADKQEPNCDVNGKHKHVKDKAACEKKKGTWIDAAAATPASATGSSATPTPAPATTTPAPVEQK